MRSRAPAAVAAIVLFASACGGVDDRPDVLLVTLDTVRADRLGCYGDTAARTPALDRLAAGGARFTRASTVAPITLPAHASILTGRYPAAHGVRNNGTFSLGEGEQSLAEVFRGAGWRTAAFVGAYVLARPYGLARGFETYDDRFEGPGAVDPPPGAAARGAKPSERRAGAVTDAALTWFRSLPRGAPTFAWVHYYDPHADYAPPEPFLSSFPDRYRGEIAYTDAELDRLLRGLSELGRLRNTLILVVSDHGEAFGEHGETQHGLFVYEPTVHVPLLVAWKGVIPSGLVVEDEVSLVDLAPTVAALVRLRLDAEVQGRDLSPALLRGESPAPRDGLLVESLLPRLEFGWSELYALRRGGWKFIDAPRPELYDLRDDNDEIENLAPARPEDARGARETVRRMVRDLEGDAPAIAGAPMDDDSLERLRSLGYVGAVSATEPTAGAADLPDPKDRIREYLETKRATTLLALGRYGEAISLMETILARDPGNLWMRLEMGRAWQYSGNGEKAEAVFRDVLLRHPDSCEAPYRLGEIAMIVRRDLREAERRFRQTLACDPKRLEAIERLSAVVLSRGNAEEARSLLERAVDLAPGDAALRVRLGDLLDDAGDFGGAEREFLAAIERDADVPGAATGLGVLDLKRRKWDDAEEWFAKAVQADPRDAVAWANLGAIALHRGDKRTAASHLERALEIDPSMEQAREGLARAR